jgi:hypothetical protein
MSFVNSFFLFALIGAAVPVLIHLLTRDRIQHVQFSTLRFFAKGAKLVVRRKKFQELFLLLMRVALLALLALAFARPFFGKKPLDTRHEFSSASVIVLDTSGSMRRPGLADALKKEALDAVGGLTDGQDAATLITFADNATIDVPMSDKIAPIKAAASAITPGYGGTNIAEALSKANELLRGVRAKKKEIVLVSDLQKSGWSYFKGDWKLASDVKLTIRGVTPTGPGSGLGIVEMSAPSSLVLDKQPSSISVRIANYSDKPQNNVSVELQLDGKKVDAQAINIRANGTAVVRFRHVFDTPGDNLGSIVVGGDAVNTAYFNARTMPRIPVLVINGRPSANPQDDGAFFIDKALAPTDASPFTVTTVDEAKVTADQVSGSSVVILADAGDAGAAVVDSLSQLLERGGGVLFLPGGQVKADAFNAAFGKIAPMKLRQILQARPANGETAESLTRIDYNNPIFDTFALPHHGDMSLPKFAQYWETTDTQLSQVLARFGDDRPAILEQQIGKGVSMALVSGIANDWNDFARQSVFLPWLHQTVRYLAVQTGQKTAYTSGELLPIPDGDSLKDPQGQSHPAPAVGTTNPGLYATQPGFYTLLDKSGQALVTYAVNGNMTEANPATISADEIAAAIEKAPDQTEDALNADATAQPEDNKKDAGLWWYLVLGILGLSFVELILGNKTLRH